MSTVLFIILTCTAMALADYACVCNYNVEQTVFYEPVDTAAAMGYIHELECKEQLPTSSLDPSWLRVIFEQSIGYVPIKNGVKLQMCQGDPLKEGIVTVAASTAITMPETSSYTTLPHSTTSTTTTAIPVTITANLSTTTKPILTTTTAQLTYNTNISTTIEQTSTTSNSKLQSTTAQPATTASTSTTSTQNPTLSSTTWNSSDFTPSTTWETTRIPITNSNNNLDGNTRLCQDLHLQHASHHNNKIGQYGAYCYEIMFHSKMSWQHAEDLCQSGHGHLVSITSAQEQAFVQCFMQRHMSSHAIWIGLHDTKTENVFEWTSNDMVSYTNWITGHLNNFLSHNQEDCVVLVPYKNGTWDDIPCGFEGIFGTDSGETHYAMCKFDVETTSQTTVPPSITLTPLHNQDGNTNICTNENKQHAVANGNNLAQYGSHCFELMSHVKVSWTNGESLCRSNQGHLLHIGSAEEQTFIDSFMQRNIPDHAVWIGLNDRHSERNFEWTTGDRVTYTNWVPGHQNSFGGDEDCVVLVPYKGGKWDDIPCGDSSSFLFGVGETHPIICQYDRCK